MWSIYDLYNQVTTAQEISRQCQSHCHYKTLSYVDFISSGIYTMHIKYENITERTVGRKNRVLKEGFGITIFFNNSVFKWKIKKRMHLIYQVRAPDKSCNLNSSSECSWIGEARITIASWRDNGGPLETKRPRPPPTTAPHFICS